MLGPSLRIKKIFYRLLAFYHLLLVVGFIYLINCLSCSILTQTNSDIIPTYTLHSHFYQENNFIKSYAFILILCMFAMYGFCISFASIE